MSYIPIGPIHPGIKEPLRIKLKTEGERVVDAEVDLGYMFRGAERIAKGKPWQKVAYLAERICGICSFAHALCYSQTIEELLSIEIPERAKFIRTIIAEMERIQNHYLWLGFTAKEMGFETLFMYSWRDRESILNILETITGKRVNYGIVTIGGLRRDLTDKMSENSLPDSSSIW